MKPTKSAEVLRFRGICGIMEKTIPSRPAFGGREGNGTIFSGDCMQNNSRHEYKFLISPSAAALLKLRLPHVMRRDPHAGPEGMYTIRSLYFDDPNYSAFWDKVDGVDNRTKYRIRCYNGDTSHCRLERKDGQLYAYPIRGKSGLITTLAGADGYFCIDRDCEGLPRFAEIQVTITQGV